MMKHRLGVLALAACILAPIVLGESGEVYRHPDPRQSLETRWAWAQEQAGRLSADEGFWIGYSIKHLMREFTYFISEGSSSFTTTTSRWRIPAGVTLQERIYGRPAGHGISDEQAIKELAGRPRSWRTTRCRDLSYS